MTGIREETKLRYDQICSIALSQPTLRLKDLVKLVPLSESQIALCLASRGIIKRKGVGGQWEQTDKIKKSKSYYVHHPKLPLPYSQTLKHIYDAMIRRCLHPNDKAYKHYGGRGITICDRWLGEEGIINFLTDMKEPPKGKTIGGHAKYTLERKNNNLGYSKENCLWDTWIHQARNRRLPIVGSRTSLLIAREIRELYIKEVSREELCLKYNISQQVLGQILHSRIWKEEKYSKQGIP